MTEGRSPPEPVTTAAEHALGVLTGEELRDARRRAQSDQQFAEEVARWRGKFAPLYSEIEAVDPPGAVWGNIEAETTRHMPANDNAAALHRQIRIWKSAVGALSVIAASLVVMLVVEPRPDLAPRQPPSQAVVAPMVALLGGNGSTKVVASWDPAARQLVLAVAGDMPTNPDRSKELWVIPPNGKPHSLGTLPERKEMHMRLADTLATLLAQGATIAISVEPRGGSPTGAPTGPVVASGPLTRA